MLLHSVLVTTVISLVRAATIDVANANQDPAPAALPAPFSDASSSQSDENIYATPTTRDQVGRIVVPVMVNDQGPFRFVVDTGANRSVLAAHMPQRLGLSVVGEEEVSLSGVTGEAVVPTVSVRRVQAGALLLLNVSMPVINATMKGIDGVLGVEGLADKRLTVDFANDRISIDRSSKAAAPRDFVVLPVRFRHGQLLVVDAMVGRVKTKAVIDTGAEGSLGNDPLRAALQRQASGERRTGSASIEGVTADVQQGETETAPLIRFQGVEIDGIEIAYGNFHVFKLWDLERTPALLVGMDVLGTVETLVIDYRRRELQIKPREKSGRSR